MKASETISKSINCCLSTSRADHYVYEAIMIPCGGNACKKCIDDLKDHEANCKYCNQKHAIKENTTLHNPHIRRMMEAYMMDDLKEKLMKELKEVSECLAVDRINEELELRLNNIEYELDTRIESIVAYLHQYRAEFMLEVGKMKQIFIKSMKYDEFEAAKSTLDSLKENGLSNDYDEFMKAHNKLNESKALLHKYMDELNQIKFESNSKIVCKDIVGELIMPFSTRMRTCSEIDLGDINSSRHSLAYTKDLNKLFISDLFGSAVFIFDFTLNTVNKFIHKEIEHPYRLCLGQNDQLFINDSTRFFTGNQVLVFDNNLNFMQKFTTDLLLNSHLRSMAVDLEDNSVYVAETNRISVWNSNSGTLIRSGEIKRPAFLKLHKENIYITTTCALDCLNDSNSGKLETCKCGYADSVLIFNKITFEIIDKISFDNWLHPYGISIGENDNILTIAYELDSNKVISNRTYLYVISKEKEMIEKIKIDHDYNYEEEFLAIDDKLLLMKDKKIKINKFGKRLQK